MFALIRMFSGLLSFLGVIAILALLTTAAAPLIIAILLVIIVPSLLSGLRFKYKPNNAQDMDRKHRSEELWWASQNMEYEFEAKKRKAEWQNQK